MLNIEYKILKLLNNNALNINGIKNCFTSKDYFLIENLLTELDLEGLIHELSVEELKTYKTENIEEQSGLIGKDSGSYITTIAGLRLAEAEKEQRIRFYMPFIFSTLISVITIAISISITR